MTFILALDPGKTVGWARFEKPNNRDGYKSGEVSSDRLWVLLESIKLKAPLKELVLIVEQFTLRRLPKIDLSAVEAIGVIKEWCRQNNYTQVRWQTPAQAKHFWTDSRLKKFKVYRPGKPHAMDAMRHLMYFMHFKMGGVDVPQA
jgi:hypothetical protein